MEKISSLQNQRVKRAVKLHTSRGRQQQNRIIVFGRTEILRAVECQVAAEEAFVCTQHLNDQSREVVEVLAAADIPMFELPDDVFQKLSYGDRSDGLVLVAQPPELDLEQLGSCLKTDETALVIVLESLEKPGNVGAVFRTADAVGAAAVVLANPVTKVFHPNSIRASLGTVFSIPCAVADSDSVIRWLTENGFSIFPAIVDTTCEYSGVDFRQRSAIVFGSESQGLSESWRDERFQAIKINMAGAADSLNVSVSAAVVAFEARRQCKEN